MERVSEGVRRLSVFTGLTGVVAWLVFVFVKTNGFTNALANDWYIIISGLAGAFAVPFFLVHGVAWVVRGFRTPP